MSLLSRDSKNK